MQENQISEIASMFQKLSDPRKKRGIRHPYHALCALVFMGLLARIVEMAVLVRWAKAHWDTLCEPLGFTRPEVPSATCISRSLAQVSLEEFRAAFAEWITLQIETENSLLPVCVDGKTCCQGLNEHGKPEIVLNLFLHDLKLAITQFSVGDSKSNEPGCLKINLEELKKNFPFVQLLTGDAIFLQRPLLSVLHDSKIDYLFQVKENQSETVRALEVSFNDERIGHPHAENVEKKMEKSIFENFGTIWRTRNI